jgi:hypothetical protein
VEWEDSCLSKEIRGTLCCVIKLARALPGPVLCEDDRRRISYHPSSKIPLGFETPTKTLKAAHALHSVRELIYETLADIPEKLSNAKKYVDIYINSRTSSQAITNHSSELYVSITEVLRHILDFFSKHALSRVAGSLLHLDNFEKCLKDHVSRMDVVLQQLIGAATLCQRTSALYTVSC